MTRNYLTDRPAITAWLKQHCDVRGTVTIDDTGEVSVIGRVTIANFEGDVLPVKFSQVSESFFIKNSALLSLVGSPDSVPSFAVEECAQLQDLTGSPVTVEYYSLMSCHRLKTLAGAPRSTNGFSCMYCSGLMDLQGAPSTVLGSFNCSYCKGLTSLKGAPEKCYSFQCDDCTNLITLEGAPLEVTAFFSAQTAAIRNLIGSPQRAGFFHVNGCKNLENFEGAPAVITGNPFDKDNGFLSAKSCPKIRDFRGLHAIYCPSIIVEETKIESWEGLPISTRKVKLSLMDNAALWPLPPQIRSCTANLWYKPTAEGFRQGVANKTALITGKTNKTNWFNLYRAFTDANSNKDYLSLLSDFERLYRQPFLAENPSAVTVSPVDNLVL